MGEAGLAQTAGIDMKRIDHQDRKESDSERD